MERKVKIVKKAEEAEKREKLRGHIGVTWKVCGWLREYRWTSVSSNDNPTVA